MDKQHAQTALEAMCQQYEIQQIIEIEPRVALILALAANPEPRHSRWVAYEALKRMSSGYVGWNARQPQLRTSQHYSAIIKAIDTLLPETGYSNDEESAG